MSEKQRFDELYASFLNSDKRLIHAGLLLFRAAQKWPHNTIVICQEQTITYQHLYQRACLMAQELKTRGVLPGDRVLIFYENSIEFYVAYFGVLQAGALVAPLNVFLHETELAHIIRDATPKVIIISPSLLSKLQGYPQDQLPEIISTIDITSILTDSTLASIKNFIIPNKSADESAAILYTSGTTGFPKGVMLSSRNMIINALQAIARFEIRSQERVYCALPLFHSLPQNLCIWTITALGATAIIVPKVDRKNLLAGFKHKPTMIMAVPAMYGLFCLFKTINFGAVRYFFSGGDALSDKIRSLFGLLYQRKICNGYGLTETSPFLCVDIDDYTQKTNTVGRPFVEISCSLRNEANEEIPHGSIGTLWVAGPNIMLGYYNSPEATAAIIKDGWLNTGDLAYIDSQGKIVLVGRQRDLISNKGMKIYPQEVENVLLSHARVLQAGVFGMSHQNNSDEIPIAYIASKDSNTDQLTEELKNLCTNTLAYYKIPRIFIVKRELPMTATGKIDKKKLKADYLDYLKATHEKKN